MQTCIKRFKDLKAFTEYPNGIDVCSNTNDYKPNRKSKILIAFVDMVSNKRFEPILTKLFICGRKLNNSTVFISQSYFGVPKNIALNSTDYPEQVAFNHSLHIDFKRFIKIYEKFISRFLSF